MVVGGPSANRAPGICGHILNAQVAIRTPCCRRWFDCAECHAEFTDHPMETGVQMAFACKKCKKCFRKDMTLFEAADEYCPHCDNHFVVDAQTPDTYYANLDALDSSSSDEESDSDGDDDGDDAGAEEDEQEYDESGLDE